jgi:hypothetical protein
MRRPAVGLLALACALLAGCGLLSSANPCPSAVDWENAAQYVGQRVTIRGPVVASHFAEAGDGQPTFLDIGKSYPDPTRFTVVIWGRDRANFPNPPDQAYRSRQVCVTGLVDTAMGSPGIEIRSPGGIVAP